MRAKRRRDAASWRVTIYARKLRALRTHSVVARHLTRMPSWGRQPAGSPPLATPSAAVLFAKGLLGRDL